MKRKTACFLGDRGIKITPQLRKEIQSTTERLIIQEGVRIFLFGDKSPFNDLCVETVTGFKENYPDLKRVYVRADYPVITKLYEEYILETYDETYMPEGLTEASLKRYAERNEKMIEESDFAIVYHNAE